MSVVEKLRAVADAIESAGVDVITADANVNCDTPSVHVMTLDGLRKAIGGHKCKRTVSGEYDRYEAFVGGVRWVALEVRGRIEEEITL